MIEITADKKWMKQINNSIEQSATKTKTQRVLFLVSHTESWFWSCSLSRGLNLVVCFLIFFKYHEHYDFIQQTFLNLPFKQYSVDNPKKQNKSTVDSLSLVKMERFAIEQRVFIVEQYFENSECLAAANNKKIIPIIKNIIGIIKKFLYILTSSAMKN